MQSRFYSTFGARAYIVCVMKPNQLGKLLKILLKNAGITQAEFAQKLGVEDKYPSHFVTGRRSLPVDKLLLQAVAALKLLPGDPQRAEFERLVLLSHSPDEMGKISKSQERKIDALQNQVVSDRLQRAIRHARYGVVELAQAIGVKRSAQMADPIHRPMQHLSLVRKIAAIISEDPQWIITGETPPSWFTDGLIPDEEFPPSP